MKTRIGRIAVLAGMPALGIYAQQPPSSSAVLPAGTVLQIRLRQTVSSVTGRAGTRVSAMVIQPVEVAGSTALPLKALLEGELTQVRRVGIGFSRETAMVAMDFHTLVLPDGARQPVRGRISLVDDSRERTDEAGRIHGIRATSSFASVISGIGISAASLDPMLMAFSLSSSLSVFRIPESEILLPAGAELSFRLEDPLTVPAVAWPPVPARLQTPELQNQWQARLREMPFRTSTPDDTPSDIVSIGYVGSGAAIQRAFEAAGWVQVDRLDSRSSFSAMRAIVENQGYRSAPMSRLLLDGKAPSFEFAKTLDTFFKRHHLRIYAQTAAEDGSPVWTSTATHDSGIAFSRASKTFIHLVDHDIDAEREKVVYDLLLTGCVDTVDYIDRPWVPSVLKNATGDEMKTDRRAALLHMNACDAPEQSAAELDPPAKVKEDAALRPVRNVMLRFKSDAFRGNIGYQSATGIRMLHKTLRRRPNPELPLVLKAGGESFEVVSGAPRSKGGQSFADPGAQLLRGERSYKTMLDISINGGYSRFANEGFSTQFFHGTPSDVAGVGDAFLKFAAPVELRTGWAISPKVTLPLGKWLSSELSFTSNRTNLRIAGIPSLNEEPQIISARLQQFSYNLLIQGRPNGSRLRPYLAVGPAFQLIRAVDARPTTNRLLKFTLADLGLITAAYQFGSKPPLEGGGIFQVGLQYGAGVKYQLSPRYFLRVDFRETLSSQPDFWSDSYKDLTAKDPSIPLHLERGELRRHGMLRHNVFTIGAGVSF